MQARDKFDFLFQNKVLALLLRDNDFLSKYGPIVKSEYFSDVQHQILCDTINNYWIKYSIAPTAEVILEYIEKTPDSNDKSLLAVSLSDILETELDDAAYYEDKLIEFCKRQSALVALKQAANHLREGDLDSVLPTIENALSIGDSISSENIGVNYWNDFQRIELHKTVPSIPTMLGSIGSGGLDDVLHGGLEQGSVGMVMIPTGRGKSVFLLNVCGNAIMQGYNVIYISMELSESLLAHRFNIFFSGQVSDVLKSMDGEAIKQMIKEKLGSTKLGNLMIKTFPMRSASVRQMESYLKLIKSKYGWSPDLICIDYLDIIKPPYQSKEKYEQHEDVAIELKAFAQRQKIPIWTASQVNRGGASKKIIRNEDSSMSYQKTFAIDVILTASPTADEETDERSAVLFCSKNRQGKDQLTLDYELDFDVMRFNYKPRAERLGNASVFYKKFLNERAKSGK